MGSMNKIKIIDFDDSFTYNIGAALAELDLPHEILSWNGDYFQQEDFSKEFVILGPGPGHPRDYPEALKSFPRLLTQAKFFMGICLGHQLIYHYFGAEVRPLPQPIHGQSIEISLPSWVSQQGGKQLVQVYNSLGVYGQPEEELAFTLGPQGEKLIGLWPRGMSYQFHPESIGTSCPEVYFGRLRQVYCQGEVRNENEWHL